MVTGGEPVQSEANAAGAHEQAVLESVASNLEAGIEMVGHQEVCLAKIGGRLRNSLIPQSCTKPRVW